MALNKPPPKKGAAKPDAGGETVAPGNPLSKPANPLAKPPTTASPTRPAPAPPPAPAAPAIKVISGKPVPAASADKVKIGASGRVTLSVGRPKAPAGEASPLGKPAATPAGGDAKAKAEEKIEEKVFAIRGMKAAKDLPLFNAFCENLAPKLALAPTGRSILEAFSNIDVTAEKVALCLKSNPYYEYHFLRHIESFGRRESTNLAAAVILLGMQNSRNLVMALQVMRTVHGTHAEWDKNGRLKLSPSEVLRYALRTEEALAGNKSGYADTAYAAGLVFDILVQLAHRYATEPKKVLPYIDYVYSHSLKTAQLGAELTKFFPEFPFHKYVFSACLLHDVGKIGLAILSPVYLNFVETSQKRGLSRPTRLFAEARRFGVNHALLSGLACYHFKMFRPIEKAILFHHEPYLLKDSNRNLFLLSSLVCLATNMASNFKKTERRDDPILALWKGMELKDFGIEPGQMLQAASRVF